MLRPYESSANDFHKSPAGKILGTGMSSTIRSKKQVTKQQKSTLPAGAARQSPNRSPNTKFNQKQEKINWQSGSVNLC